MVVEAEADTTMEVETPALKTYEEALKFVTPIAKPMASRKLTKKVYKCVRKASKDKKLIFRGIKSVLKALKKGEKGIVIFAGDTEPVEIICHLPLVCEEADLPYCYVPSKAALGAACGSRKHTCCMFIKSGEAFKELFDDCKVGIKKLPSPCL